MKEKQQTKWLIQLEFQLLTNSYVDGIPSIHEWDYDDQIYGLSIAINVTRINLWTFMTRNNWLMNETEMRRWNEEKKIEWRNKQPFDVIALQVHLFCDWTLVSGTVHIDWTNSSLAQRKSLCIRFLCVCVYYRIL